MVAKQGMREVQVAHWLLNVSTLNGVMLLSLTVFLPEQGTWPFKGPGCTESGNVQEQVDFWWPLQTSLPQ